MRELSKLLLNPKLLYIKISRRVRYKYFKIKMRFIVQFNLDLGDISLSFNSDLYRDLIAKPGNPVIFDQPHTFSSIKVSNDIENILNHKFKVFS